MEQHLLHGVHRAEIRIELDGGELTDVHCDAHRAVVVAEHHEVRQRGALDEQIEAGGGVFPAPEAGAFYAQLEEREEELLLFSLRKEDVLPPFPQDVPSFFMQERFPLARAGFAVSAALYRRAAALCTPATALDLLLCPESAASVPSPLFKAEPLPWNEGQVLGSVRFFNAAKAGMDAEKYRYAFSFLRERITGVYAALCAQGDRSALCTFDEALKRECPALRVAAFRSAPLQFLSILQKKNFERGLLASAGAKLALFSEKRQ